MVTSACWGFFKPHEQWPFSEFQSYIITPAVPPKLKLLPHSSWMGCIQKDCLEAPGIAASEGGRFSEMSKGSHLHRPLRLDWHSHRSSHMGISTAVESL